MGFVGVMRTWSDLQERVGGARWRGKAIRERTWGYIQYIATTLIHAGMGCCMLEIWKYNLPRVDG